MHALPLIAEVPAISTEYVRAIVEGYEGGRLIDPTIMGVQFAFTLGANPGLNDWANGTWDNANGTYFARGLFGPGAGRPLAPGDWTVWLRIISNPEQPARRLGVLRTT